VMDTALWLIVTDCCSKQRVHLDWSGIISLQFKVIFSHW
jgi:hypothetical protein